MFPEEGINMPKAKYIMTIEGLEIQPIAIEIISFGWTPSQSLSGAPIYALPDQRDFRIRKISDKWSPSLLQASITGQQLQVTVRVDTEDEGDLVTRVTYSFSNALIASIQRSGTGPEPIESIRFSFKAFDMKNSSDSPGALYGSAEGKNKVSDMRSRSLQKFV